jgi:hypothetical protein
MVEESRSAISITTVCRIFTFRLIRKEMHYLNKGNFTFEDITLSAGVSVVGNWKTGVTMADVNGGGCLDIFVCGVVGYKKFNDKNQLSLNNGELTFSVKAEEYGLNFQGFSTQASFFDHDNDGDLVNQPRRT